MTSVCIVRENYYPFQRNLRRNAETLARHGYAVDVICQRAEGQKRREIINGVSVYRLPLKHHRGRIFQYFSLHTHPSVVSLTGSMSQPEKTNIRSRLSHWSSRK